MARKAHELDILATRAPRMAPGAALRGMALAVWIAAGSVYGQSAGPSPAGQWHTFGDGGAQPRAVIRITEANGVFTGRIVRSLVPGEDPDKLCTKCSGERHGQRLMGMAFLTGMKRVDGEFGGGEILDPDTGGVYRSNMRLSDNGRRLMVRGYVGIPLFGRSQEWVRAD